MGNSATPISTVALFGEFGPPLLTAARCFRDAGIEVVAIGIGSGKPIVWSNAISRATSIRHGDVGTTHGLAMISVFVEETRAQALLAFWDPTTMWLAANRDALPRGCKLLTSSSQVLRSIESKRDQLDIARRCGFSILPTWQLKLHADVGRVEPSAYPVCLRPSTPQQASPPFKVEVLPSPSALNAFLTGRRWGPEPLLVQPFRPYPSVVVHCVKSESGELLALETFIASMKFEGISLELQPWRRHDSVAACCRLFADEVGVTGPFHFDLLYSAEKDCFYYLEINARLGGTTDKVVRLGFDEPLLTLAAYGFDIAAAPYKAQTGRSVVNRKSVLKHMLSIAKGRLSPLDYPVAGPFHHLLLSLRSLLWDEDSVASMRDLRGTMFCYTGGPRSPSLPLVQATETGADQKISESLS